MSGCRDSTRPSYLITRIACRNFIAEKPRQPRHSSWDARRRPSVDTRRSLNSCRGSTSANPDKPRQNPDTPLLGTSYARFGVTVAIKVMVREPLSCCRRLTCRRESRPGSTPTARRSSGVSLAFSTGAPPVELPRGWSDGPVFRAPRSLRAGIEAAPGHARALVTGHDRHVCGSLLSRPLCRSSAKTTSRPGTGLDWCRATRGRRSTGTTVSSEEDDLRRGVPGGPEGFDVD